MSSGKVLVVDDEPALLRMLQLALESEGYRVMLASDGRTALTRAREEQPDLVLLDIMMPVIDGWAVLEELRGMDCRPKIVCFTAKDSNRDRLKGWRLGADEYVTKPVDMDRLLGLVGDVLSRTRGGQEERRRQALRELGADPVESNGA